MMSQNLKALWNSGQVSFWEWNQSFYMYEMGIFIALFISSTHLALEVFHFMWGDPGLIGLGSSCRFQYIDFTILDTFYKPSHASVRLKISEGIL